MTIDATDSIQKYTEIEFCRVCENSDLVKILSLGSQYISNYVDEKFVHSNDDKVPLDLVLCPENSGGCGLLQSKHSASRELLYKEYWFRSGLNESMKSALKDITLNVEKMSTLNSEDLVLDVGCNDGSLLRSYDANVIKVGFEPASNLVNEAKVGTNFIINDFFNSKNFFEIFPEKKCKVITSIAMFYDLDDPNEFVKNIADCLHSNGIWIIQMAYLIPMLKLNGFDNIGHEHLEYYSVKALNVLIEKHGLKIFHVEKNDVYGGSIRAYMTHKNNNEISTSPSVQNIIQDENNLGLDDMTIYNEFADRVNKIKDKLRKFISEQVNNGKTVYVYGASTKGNTLLQFCDFDTDLIAKAVDRDKNKIGKMTIGTKIPIISEEQARLEHPDFLLVLPWHLIDFFKEREQDYLKSGGKLIVPIPKVKIIEETNEYEL
jgi:2-polyprenyl-3-methyl-5-hydroxy-6-metoxy-1,4-benzoquinol methylase